MTPISQQYPNLSFQSDVFSSPLPGMQLGSPMFSTPPQFSVSNFTSDPPRVIGADLGFNQFGCPSCYFSDALRHSYMLPALSMTVIGRCPNHVSNISPEQNPKSVDRLVPDLSPATEGTESQDVGSYDWLNKSHMTGSLASRTLRAKDLLNSDLLTSFLNPNPVIIPVDPFGIGAETSVGDMENDTWHDVELTPPQSRRPIAGVPPALKKKNKKKLKRKRKLDEMGNKEKMKSMRFGLESSGKKSLRRSSIK